MKKVVVIIQARMGSTRLPQKVMMKLSDKTVLAHDIERVKQCKLVNDIVIATTISKNDDNIALEAEKNGAKVYRGSEENVLERYYEAARENKADVVVRITSDCPLIDPYIIDQMIDIFLSDNYDMVTNGGSDLSKRTFPRGLDVEVFSFYYLDKAYKNVNKKYQKEHVTPYIYEDSNNIYYHMSDEDYSKYRLTLDTEEDLEVLKIIYKSLYKGKHNFYYRDILEFLDENPNIMDINKDIEQKKLDKG